MSFLLKRKMQFHFGEVESAIKRPKTTALVNYLMQQDQNLPHTPEIEYSQDFNNSV